MKLQRAGAHRAPRALRHVASFAIACAAIGAASTAGAEESYSSETGETTVTIGRPSRKPIPYFKGDAVPDGYRLEGAPRMGLVAAGISIGSALWTISTIAAIALDGEESKDGDPNFDDMYWPMFIPVLGPFITIGTADSSGTGAAILALDGALQVGSLAMIIAGVAAPKWQLVPKTDLKIGPAARAGGMALELGGSF